LNGYSGENDIRKPHPEVYYEILNHFEVDPSSVAILDDEPKYLEKPKEIGFLTVLVGKKDERFDVSGSDTIEVLEILGKKYDILKH